VDKGRRARVTTQTDGDGDNNERGVDNRQTAMREGRGADVDEASGAGATAADKGKHSRGDSGA